MAAFNPLLESSWRLASAGACAAVLLAGCASTQLDAQWADPQLATGTPLRGARVLVVCEAQDQVLRRVCIDQVSAQVVAAGAVPIAAPDVGDAAATAPGGPAPYVAAAKAANAKAVLVTAVAPNGTVAKPGFTLGIGLGGFGGGVGGGVGVSAPIGGSKVETGYAANASVTDVASGRLMWTARASESPSGDVNAQVSSLAQKVVAGATKAGLF
ncbi:MAG: hypothetical protein H7Y33_10815 [Cytophagales bacterium]|nr:hypothetical protein [Rhizobacter sp.]